MKFSNWINENIKKTSEEKKNFVNAVWQKYAPSVSGIDQNRYTKLDGLEGPFKLRSGKVVYYDPKEGKYYDRDSDIYMSDDEYHSHSNPRSESITYNQQIDQIKQNKKDFGQMASGELSNIMSALQILAKENPSKFRVIVSMIQKAIDSSNKDLSKEIASGYRRVIGAASRL